MERYYFDVEIDRELVKDDIGSDLPAPDAVQSEAASLLVELARSKLHKGDLSRVAATVRREGDQPVLRATLSLTFEEIPGSLGHGSASWA